MAYKEVKEELNQVKEHSEAYINTSLQYYKLWGFKVSVKAASQFMTLVLLSLFSMMALLFLSLAVAFALNDTLDSPFLGFILVGIFYVIVTIIAYLCRSFLVEKPVFKKLSEIIFND